MLVTYYTHASGGLTVRSGPGITFKDLGKLPLGTKVAAAMGETRPSGSASYSSPTIGNNQDQWVYITGPKKGWVAFSYKGNQYLKSAPPPKPKPSWSPKKPTTTPAPSKTPGAIVPAPSTTSAYKAPSKGLSPTMMGLGLVALVLLLQ